MNMSGSMPRTCPTLSLLSKSLRLKKLAKAEAKVARKTTQMTHRAKLSILIDVNNIIINDAHTTHHSQELQPDATSTLDLEISTLKPKQIKHRKQSRIQIGC